MQCVAIDLHDETVGLASGRNGLCDQTACDVVRARSGSAIGSGNVEADPAGGRRRVQRYREGETGGATVAFVGADVVDAQPRQVIVAQGTGGTGRRAALMPGAGGEGQRHGLVRFGNRVRDGRDAHGRAGGTCADHQRRTDCGVVGTAGSGAAQAAHRHSR
ncbi:hypothetical protein G6F63_014990 [Rhizopus arrhizus]|nr:hypothetical protein G6F63_014990 [Rhizopus arrhizus]